MTHSNCRRPLIWDVHGTVTNSFKAIRVALDAALAQHTLVISATVPLRNSVFYQKWCAREGLRP